MNGSEEPLGLGDYSTMMDNKFLLSEGNYWKKQGQRAEF